VTWGLAFRARQYLKGSLWLLPLLAALAGPLLAQADLAAESHITLPADWQYSESTAATVLSAVVASMIGLTGIVVAVGVVVVQMASSTLSARYMRLWYRDPLQKAVLASFVGTFTFAYALLRRVGPDSVPSVGVTISGLAVAVSLVLFLLYLDRFIHRLRPVAVAELVARAGSRVLDAMEAYRDDAHASSGDVPTPADGLSTTMVGAPRARVVQAVDLKGLIRLGHRHDCRLSLVFTVGDFVPAGAPLVEIHGGRPAPAPRHVLGLFAFGTERTIEQDAAFALRIIVDIAIRALSPAVNDPTTAVQLLDHIETLLQRVGQTRHDGRIELRDAQGQVRVVSPARDWEDYLAVGLTEIREYGRTSTQVTRRLQALYEQLLVAVRPEHRPAIRAEMARLEEDLDAVLDDPSRRAFAGTPDRQGLGGPPPRGEAGAPTRAHARVRQPPTQR
jgi:uncharacterized membrane protein